MGMLGGRRCLAVVGTFSWGAVALLTVSGPLVLLRRYQWRWPSSVHVLTQVPGPPVDTPSPGPQPRGGREPRRSVAHLEWVHFPPRHLEQEGGALGGSLAGACGGGFRGQQSRDRVTWWMDANQPCPQHWVTALSLQRRG